MATTSTRSFSLTNRMTAPASMDRMRMLSMLKLINKKFFQIEKLIVFLQVLKQVFSKVQLLDPWIKYL
jgi:hypothetical protein